MTGPAENDSIEPKPRPREGFTDAECAWLDKVAAQHRPLSVTQEAVVRRFYRPIEDAS